MQLIITQRTFKESYHHQSKKRNKCVEDSPRKRSYLRKNTKNKTDFGTGFLTMHSVYTRKWNKTIRELRGNNLPPRMLCQTHTILPMFEEKIKLKKPDIQKHAF